MEGLSLCLSFSLSNKYTSMFLKGSNLKIDLTSLWKTLLPPFLSLSPTWSTWKGFFLKRQMMFKAMCRLSKPSCARKGRILVKSGVTVSGIQARNGLRWKQSWTRQKTNCLSDLSEAVWEAGGVHLPCCLGESQMGSCSIALLLPDSRFLSPLHRVSWLWQIIMDLAL